MGIMGFMLITHIYIYRERERYYIPGTQLTFFFGNVNLPFHGSNLPKYGLFGL